jgi:gamma-glutamylcyclotransferase (GGCT)/AIG2-like uncharacterized protein YtfP
MRLFVYGSLKQGQCSHDLLERAGVQYLARATTKPSYRLYQIDWFPGMKRGTPEGDGVQGEVYEIDNDEVWLELDAYEGIDSGLFKKEEIELSDGSSAIAYLYNRSVKGKKEITDGCWQEEEGDS